MSAFHFFNERNIYLFIWPYIIDCYTQQFNCVPNLTASMSVLLFLYQEIITQAAANPEQGIGPQQEKRPPLNGMCYYCIRVDLKFIYYKMCTWVLQSITYSWVNQSVLVMSEWFELLAVSLHVKVNRFWVKWRGKWPQWLIKCTLQQFFFWIIYMILFLAILHLECHPGHDLKASHL